MTIFSWPRGSACSAVAAELCLGGGSARAFEPEGRPDPEDIDHRLDWLRAQGMLKSPVKAVDVIERRYLISVK